MFEKVELWKQQKKRLGLKYDDIAIMSNIPKGTIQNIFAGYIDNPRIDTVQAIEKALGLTPSAWTEEEKAEGVGRHPTYLSEDEIEWLGLRSEILEKRGNEFYSGLITTLKALIKAL